MDDLDLWLHAPTLSGFEAACLIAGVDPGRPDAEKYKAIPALAALREGYARASYGENTERTLPSELFLRKLEELEGPDFVGWLDSKSAAFDIQRFSPEVIGRFLEQSGIPSKFSFDRHGRVAQRGAKAATKSAATRVENTLYKLVLGMAMDAYAYEPGDAKSDASKRISDSISEFDIDVSDDTIRKHLTIAKGTVSYTAKRRRS